MKKNTKNMRQSAPQKKSVTTPNNERKYNLFISPVPLAKKPQTNEETAAVHHSFIATGITYEQLVTNATYPRSYAIAPAMFANNYRNRKNWQSQSVYMLDFDNTITIDEVFKRFEEYGITPNYYYYTFSHTAEAPRFRVVLLTDYENTNIDSCLKILNGLHKAFPEADKNALRPESFLYGGKECYPITDKPVPFAKLEEMISLFVLDSDGGKTRGLLSEEEYQSIQMEHQRFLESDNLYDYLKYLESLKANTFDFDKLYNNVRIYKDFIDGKWLYHNQLFGIATNLHWLKGGAKLFRETMEKHNKNQKTFYSAEKFKIINYVAKREYLPMKLSNFSPHEEDYKHFNLITSVRLPKGSIIQTKEQKYISLEEGEQIFKRETDRILNTDEKKIFILKVPTGFGKTTFLTKLRGHLLAFPTHKLKNEVSQKMVVPFYMVPELPDFSAKELKKEIKRLYDIGYNEGAHRALIDIATGRFPGKYSYADQTLANNYINALNNIPLDGTTIMTTHQRAIHSNSENSTIIFDEDPIKDILSIKSADISDLAYLNSNLPDEYKFSQILDDLKKSKSGMVTPIEIKPIPSKILFDALRGTSIKTNVVHFLNSTFALKNKSNESEINYLIQNDLPDDKKVIIMSATPQVELYEKLYLGRVEVIDISNIRSEGKVNQHTRHSMSRTSMDELTAFDINEAIGYTPAVTFKSKKGMHGHIKLDMHFFNLQGYDELKGQDIAVIGTPHFNEAVYRLYAAAVGIDPNNVGELEPRMVEHGNYRFRFRSFESKEMQTIQLNLIESELIQAVGRARILREDCVVELYSNLPLSFSILDDVNCIY